MHTTSNPRHCTRAAAMHGTLAHHTFAPTSGWHRCQVSGHWVCHYATPCGQHCTLYAGNGLLWACTGAGTTYSTSFTPAQLATVLLAL